LGLGEYKMANASSVTKVLVANRGEIALRVMKTAKAMGYGTVAVYSEADADAPHVQFADESVCIGPAQVNQSYLVIDKIIDACKKTGADAVHPGYGFLSENTEFCAACQKNGITFIGPDPKAIELMGNKRLAKIEMLAANVPCIPGYEGSDQSEDILFSESQKIGFPVMIKATAGGGGRGMRLVWKQEDFLASLKTAKSESLNAFGSDEVILEKAVINPRHIEIQVFADRHGNCIYLGERDCSIQRRHQKVVEEAPSPFVSEALRIKMGEAAVNAAKACDYVGAGTVEFLTDDDANFYFLEMNTRLQVEHPVTELVTDVDLVAWQLTIAAGGFLPKTQEEVTIKGHAMEVRLYAEDPAMSFMPQTGKVLSWKYSDGIGLRMDAGIREGQVITPFYDPMLAKVIAYGSNRDEARRRLMASLKNINLLGVRSNRGFLYNILANQVFADGGATTGFIEQDFNQDETLIPHSLTLEQQALAGWLFYLKDAAKYTNDTERSFWRNSNQSPTWVDLAASDHTHSVGINVVSAKQKTFSITASDEIFDFSLIELKDNEVSYINSGIKTKLNFAFSSDQAVFLETHEGCVEVENKTHAPAVSAESIGNGQIKASMDGGIIDVLVEVGAVVTKGQTLLVLEAMKMEHGMKSNSNGVVKSVLVSKGDQVKGRQLLVEIETDEVDKDL
jgi:geranyl-CoA carboxylase alpha subunit